MAKKEGHKMNNELCVKIKVSSSLIYIVGKIEN